MPEVAIEATIIINTDRVPKDDIYPITGKHVKEVCERNGLGYIENYLDNTIHPIIFIDDVDEE